MNFSSIQSFMREHAIGAWLIHDFRGNNAVLARMLSGKRWTTRRVVLCIPASGPARLLVHHIDAAQFEIFAGQGIQLTRYLTWQEFHQHLKQMVGGLPRVAMEYAPGASLPAVAIVDAGTVELIRSLGVEVVSSADLIQISAAAWSEAAQREHANSSCLVAGIKDEAFAFIRSRLASGQKVFEHEAAQLVRDRFVKEGMEYLDGPIVAANAHAGDPHYEPSDKHPTEIRKGDWVLLDLWARRTGEEHIFSDITWVACAGEPTAKQREVFGVVKSARDAALALAQRSWREKKAVEGWQLDDAAMQRIIVAGYQANIKHRTGHSLSPGPLVHGLGMNLDNLETHDTRRMLAGTGFTIEPGVYLADFGVRLEINVFVDAAKGPVVTSCVQDEIVRLA